MSELLTLAWGVLMFLVGVVAGGRWLNPQAFLERRLRAWSEQSARESRERYAEFLREVDEKLAGQAQGEGA